MSKPTITTSRAWHVTTGDGAEYDAPTLPGAMLAAAADYNHGDGWELAAQAGPLVVRALTLVTLPGEDVIAHAWGRDEGDRFVHRGIGYRALAELAARLNWTAETYEAVAKAIAEARA